MYSIYRHILEAKLGQEALSWVLTSSGLADGCLSVNEVSGEFLTM